MTSASRHVLVITCDEPPRPPLNGNNRKTYDIIQALEPIAELNVIVYPESDDDYRRLIHHWKTSSVRFYPLRRRARRKYWRAVVRQLSLPTVTRDFDAELQIVRQVKRQAPSARLLIDLISGSPLCERVQGGVVVSGHDCMSYFWRQMAEWAESPASKLHSLVRRRFALQAERRYYHLANRVHLVSSRDAGEIAKVNPRANCFVLPLAGRRADTANLRAWSERKGGAIWGNISIPPIATSVKRLLARLAVNNAGKWRDWLLLGALPEAEAVRRLPLLRKVGLRYVQRTENLGALLGSIRFLILPDLAGAGQKNRCLDGLAHGVCLVGCAEAFRDLPGVNGREFLQLGIPEDLADFMHRPAESKASEIGLAGKEMFEKHFTYDAQRARWLDVFAELPPLDTT